MMDKNALVNALKSAAWIVLPGALISLLICMVMLSSDVLGMLLPVWLAVIFTVVSWVLVRIPFIANRVWIKVAIAPAIVIVTVIGLRFFF